MEKSPSTWNPPRLGKNNDLCHVRSYEVCSLRPVVFTRVGIHLVPIFIVSTQTLTSKYDYTGCCTLAILALSLNHGTERLDMQRQKEMGCDAQIDSDEKPKSGDGVVDSH